MTLNDFIGNENIKNEIAAALEKESLPHAIMIEGAKGTGKRTLARILASACVCTASSVRPCGVCPSCIKAERDCHPDIVTADGAKSGELSVNSIRRIRSDAYIKPNEANKRVFMLLDCDRMLPPAQNAFLKVLEEPPGNVVFIITVSSANMLLETVRSRCRLLTLYPVTPEQAAEAASKYYPEKDYGELLSYARLCDGNIGQTLQMVESGGEKARREAQEIFSLIGKTGEYDLLLKTSQACRERLHMSAVIDCLMELSAECIKASVGAECLSPVAAETASRLTTARCMKLADNLQRIREASQTNVNLNFFGTWLCAMLKI